MFQSSVQNTDSASTQIPTVSLRSRIWTSPYYSVKHSTPEGDEGWSVELCVRWYLGHSAYQTPVISFLSTVIHVPGAEQEEDAVSLGSARFDQSPVFSKDPGEPDAGCYRNQKLFAFIFPRAVNNNLSMFLDVLGRVPDSVHNPWVLQHSPLSHTRLHQPAGFYMRENAGYPWSISVD